MRIDVFLCESRKLKSRTEAKKFIEKGLVTVGGKQVLKPSFEIDGFEDDVIVD